MIRVGGFLIREAGFMIRVGGKGWIHEYVNSCMHPRMERCSIRLLSRDVFPTTSKRVRSRVPVARVVTFAMCLSAAS